MVVAQERYENYSLPVEESRNLRLPGKGRLPRKGMFALTGLVVLLFCTGMLIAFYYTQVIISGYKIYGISRELASIRQETIALEEEVNKMASLNRVEALATTKLGMVKPGSGDLVLIDADLARDSRQVSIVVPGAGNQYGVIEPAARKAKSKIIQAFADLIGIQGS